MDWKNLILGTIGVVAAPFTGGASLALTGSALAAHAASSAADTQAAAGQQALTLGSQINARQHTALNPYTATGSGALTNLQGLTGRPQTVGSLMGAPVGNTGGATLMVAPNGDTELVPAALVGHYTSLGARPAPSGATPTTALGPNNASSFAPPTLAPAGVH